MFTALEGSSLVPRPHAAFRCLHRMQGEPGNEAKRKASFSDLKEIVHKHRWIGTD